MCNMPMYVQYNQWQKIATLSQQRLTCLQYSIVDGKKCVLKEIIHSYHPFILITH